jgi:hypothetical protein
MNINLRSLTPSGRPIRRGFPARGRLPHSVLWSATANLAKVATSPGTNSRKTKQKHRINMPLVNVDVLEKVFTPEQKGKIIADITNVMVAIEGEPLCSVTWVRIMHFLAVVPLALLLFVIFRSPLGIGAGVLLFAFAGWRYIMGRRPMDFLREAPITLGELLVSKFRVKRSVYRIVMSYTFEGRTYSSPQEIDQEDHLAVLSREISLHALFDCRNPGKMLSYHAGSVMPRRLKSRSEPSPVKGSCCSASPCSSS